MSEYTPPAWKVKLTTAQVRKYVADIKAAQKIAQAKLNAAKQSGELEKDAQDLEQLDDMINDL
jgi:hypothetical protein